MEGEAMLVSTNTKDIKMNNAEDIIAYIKSINEHNMEMWIFGDEQYPCMSICISGNLAAINYYENEDGDMWLSYKESNQKEVTFLAGGEEWTPDVNAVITLEEVYQCIKAFSMNQNKPMCIEWQEL